MKKSLIILASLLFCGQISAQTSVKGLIKKAGTLIDSIAAMATRTTGSSIPLLACACKT